MDALRRGGGGGGGGGWFGVGVGVGVGVGGGGGGVGGGGRFGSTSAFGVKTPKDDERFSEQTKDSRALPSDDAN